MKPIKVSTNKGIFKYGYNDKGLRITKTGPSGTMSYFWDGDKLIAEYKEGFGLKATYLYGVGGSQIHRKDALSGKIHYYFHNAHGDVTALTDGSGNVSTLYDYNAYGEVNVRGENIENPFKYFGQYYDEETGSYYLRARYYDPAISRMLTEDSYKGDSKDPLSLDLYNYCKSSPILFIDPSGHKAKRIVDEFGVVTWEFTNLNITVFESGAITDTLDPSEKTILTGFHTNAYAANKGEFTYAISEKGIYYFTIEDLASLDKEYFWKGLLLGGKTALSFAADTAATISGYKAVTGCVIAGKSVAITAAEGFKALLSPGKDISGVNFVVTQAGNVIEDKSLAEKVKGFLLNFFPYIGTYDGVIKLTDESPKVELGK